MLERLFVYGSLQPGEANEHVLAQVRGTWCRGSIRGRLIRLGWGAAMGYTGLILDDAGDAVPGHMLESSDLRAHWSRLDAFEGEDYERLPASVELEDGTEKVAFVYVLRGRPGGS